jgi:predicted LPLAT superfamily acyltransferase
MLQLPLSAVLITTLFLGSDGIKVMRLVIVAVVVAFVVTKVAHRAADRTAGPRARPGGHPPASPLTLTEHFLRIATQ